MKRNRTIIPALLVAASSLLPTACDCPQLTAEPTIDPRVREATVTEFNAVWNESTSTPGPRYSIHTFEFPTTKNSSGNLPNDDRIANGDQLVVESEKFRLAPDTTLYTAQVVTRRPANSELIGDVMVVSVDLNAVPPTARLRFAGRVAKFAPPSLNSGSAEDFAGFLIARRNEYDLLTGQSSLFGAGLSGQQSTSNTNSLRVLDSQGNDVTGSVTPPQEVLDNLQDELDAEAVEVEVAIGEVYYYKARNGVEFGVLIEDIRAGSLSPNLNRLTIKFSELRGPSDC